MIKKQYRLRASRHVDRAIRKGIAFNGQVFRVKAFAKRSKNEPSRISVILSAKRFKTAVSRNLIRRRVKAAFYNHLKAVPGFDLAIFPVAGENIEFSKIEEEAGKCFEFLQSRR